MTIINKQIVNPGNIVDFGGLATIRGNQLSWDSNQKDDLGDTSVEIWGSQTNDRTTAIIIETIKYTNFYEHQSESDTLWYYWARRVDSFGGISDWTSGEFEGFPIQTDQVQTEDLSTGSTGGLYTWRQVDDPVPVNASGTDILSRIISFVIDISEVAGERLNLTADMEVDFNNFIINPSASDEMFGFMELKLIDSGHNQLEDISGSKRFIINLNVGGYQTFRQILGFDMEQYPDAVYLEWELWVQGGSNNPEIIPPCYIQDRRVTVRTSLK